MLRTARLLPLLRALDTGLRRRALPPDAASLLPGSLAITWTGLPPAGGDELADATRSDHRTHRPPLQSRVPSGHAVVHPAHHDRVDHRGKLDQIAPDPHVQTPLTHLLPHRGEGVLADRGQEPGVTATPVLAQGLPRTEREPQERERRVLVIAPSNAVLAVSGSPGESHPQAPTERSVTVSRHSALTTQSAGTGESMPSARTAWGRVARPLATTPSDA